MISIEKIEEFAKRGNVKAQLFLRILYIFM